MVGVGEATLGPAAISLLSDYFPPLEAGDGHEHLLDGHRDRCRTRGTARRSLSQFGWRTAFMIVGFPGIDARRAGFLSEGTGPVTCQCRGHQATRRPTGKSCSRTRRLSCFASATRCSVSRQTTCRSGERHSISRLHKFDLPTIGFWGGILTLAAGIPATLFGGAIADWFRERWPGGRMIYGSLLSLVSVPFWLLLIFTNNVYLILLANFVLLAAALGWLGAAAADATEIAGVNLRGLAIAIYFFSVNIAAYLIGSNLIGYLERQFRGDRRSGNDAICPAGLPDGVSCQHGDAVNGKQTTGLAEVKCPGLSECH